MRTLSIIIVSLLLTGCATRDIGERNIERASEAVVDVESCVSVFVNSFDRISPEAGHLRLVRRPGSPPWLGPDGPVATNCLVKIGQAIRSGGGERFGLAPDKFTLSEVGSKEAKMILVSAGRAFPVSIRYRDPSRR